MPYTQQNHIHPILVCVNLVLSLSAASWRTILLFPLRNWEKIELGPIRCPIYLKSSAMQI